MKKRSLIWLLAGIASLAIVAGVALAQSNYKIVTVVKITGIGWFNRMEQGVTEYAEATGNDATQTGPAEADPAQQLSIIRDLVARKPDAIAVVPMDPATLEPILAEAMDRGIVVVTHEATNQVNTMYDIEAFDNTAFGAGINEVIANCMGGEGKWTVFVGSLGSKTHNQWADGGIANAADNYPNMELVDAKQETFDDADKAYEKAKEMLRKYPDIKGFQGSASTDVVGIGRAIDEAGLSDTVCLAGAGLPSSNVEMIEAGIIDGVGYWDPADAGKAMNVVAAMVLDGVEIVDGMDLGIPGYENIALVDGAGEGKIIFGKAMKFANKDNLADHLF